MMLVRVLAVLIFLFGLAATVMGISSLQIVETSVAIMEQMREAGSRTLDGIDLPVMRMILYVTYALTTLIGALSIISGIGIFLRKNWARLLWFGTLCLMAIWITYSWIMSTINRGLEATNFVTNAVILLLLAVLFFFFSLERTKSYFEVK